MLQKNLTVNSTTRSEKLVWFTDTMDIIYDSREKVNKKSYDSIRYNEKILAESLIDSIGDRAAYHKKTQYIK